MMVISTVQWYAMQCSTLQHSTFRHSVRWEWPSGQWFRLLWVFCCCCCLVSLVTDWQPMSALHSHPPVIVQGGGCERGESVCECVRERGVCMKGEECMWKGVRVCVCVRGRVWGREGGREDKREGRREGMREGGRVREREGEVENRRVWGRVKRGKGGRGKINKWKGVWMWVCKC